MGCRGIEPASIAFASGGDADDADPDMSVPSELAGADACGGGGGRGAMGCWCEDEPAELCGRRFGFGFGCGGCEGGKRPVGRSPGLLGSPGWVGRGVCDGPALD